MRQVVVYHLQVYIDDMPDNGRDRLAVVRRAVRAALEVFRAEVEDRLLADFEGTVTTYMREEQPAVKVTLAVTVDP